MESNVSAKICKFIFALAVIWLSYHYAMPSKFNNAQSTGRIEKIKGNG